VAWSISTASADALKKRLPSKAAQRKERSMT
jgi:hypothetical protein